MENRKTKETKQTKETLEKQLQILSERFCKTEDIKECCLLNKEARKTAKLLVKMENLRLGT